MTFITQEELSAIRARCEAARPQPWSGCPSWSQKQTAEFAMQCHKDVPRLLDALESAKARAVQSKAELDALIEANVNRGCWDCLIYQKCPIFACEDTKKYYDTEDCKRELLRWIKQLVQKHREIAK